MAFVKFRTLTSDFYFPERRIREMRVTDSDDVSRGYHMTTVILTDQDAPVVFYCEPIFR